MSSFEQANMLLRGARDANDNIRDQNAANTRNWEQTQKIDDAEKEGQSWYHGVLDTAGAGRTMASIYDTTQRIKTIGGGSYAKLASVDAARFTNKISGAANTTINSIKSGIDAAGEKYGATIENIGAKAMGLDNGIEIGEAGYQAAPSFTRTVAGGLARNETGGFVGVQSTADLSAEDLKNAKVNFGELTPAAVNTTEDVGKVAGIGAVGLEDVKGGVGGVASKLLGVEAKSIAGTALGKSIGNVGGAIDLYKDFENIGKPGGFFGGTGGTKLDEVGNAITIGATALDVASVALPFLAPIAAVTQLVGAGISTYDAIHDADNQTQNDKSNYQKTEVNYEVPPSLAGTGFLASQQVDTHKLTTGTGIGAF